MPKISQMERKRLAALIRSGQTLPIKYRNLLFAKDDFEYVEATKDCRLVYKEKISKEEVLRKTPAAPLQQIRTFNADNSHEDGWKNMLIFGDNLLALKSIYNDQRGANEFKTKNKIKLIYIDPPFATKQDFMKDREKVYRDKVIGAKFIEFLRRRLIIMREILASDGVIYVHLDTKKGHYIKIILDEVFGEENFLNEIIWRRSTSHSDAQKYGQVHDNVFYYSKSNYYFWETQYKGYKKSYTDKYFRFTDEDGRRYWKEDATGAGAGPARKFGERIIEPPSGRHWRWVQIKIDEHWKNGRFVFTSSGKPEFKRYLDEQKGEAIGDLWDDVKRINMMATERLGYPTQKPEELLERIISASSEEGSIVLDAFVGSGTTVSVAEKLNRKWIGIDSGKLSIYTTQKRLLNLNNRIGPPEKDEYREHDRVSDFIAHSKSLSRGMFLVYEKARKGDLTITDNLLKDLSNFLEKYIQVNERQCFSLICPESKFKIRTLKVVEEELKVGEKAIDIGNIRFLISFIQKKEKSDTIETIRAKEFALYHAGIYDKELILNLEWSKYRSFVLQLFAVREDPHKICGLKADGYIGLYSAYLWEYPNYPNLVLDKGYIQSLHEIMQGKAGDRFYVIAPGAVMTFMDDEIQLGETNYVILKVPLSVLMALIEKGEIGALKQPANENSINDVIDAVGYDFISQPVVEAEYNIEKPLDIKLFNQDTYDYVIRISDFRSNTLVSDPEDFEPFETLSMVLIDTDYKNETFNLSKVFWKDNILNNDKNEAIIRLNKNDILGETILIIYIDNYGNELKICKNYDDFISC